MCPKGADHASLFAPYIRSARHVMAGYDNNYEVQALNMEMSVISV